jgi:hypothetical protein
MSDFNCEPFTPHCSKRYRISVAVYQQPLFKFARSHGTHAPRQQAAGNRENLDVLFSEDNR